ncbi:MULTISPECIES: preprotein translocase subunit SecE [unclassified Streptococcus]|uniref:preprotein translocase subunit SecE n=1 Tax=unclassified Streptococcus TaxID=2608887 RepID=UPI0010728966|nr:MULTISPECIES: preprotein translocase subunit SecE [unclassified Streptococcus]MBF0788044.1 preprotein translocase subunit SecE [Streptococcus sp. 19428wC2_LYSM12]MCQ9211857.1 preprotein translocase subunit SecE [Streptococcus sp. B01]MCQ9212978.1 preprotein translocase subunit SecE [Streptococcus sp. O1]TFV04916.1 preprotein translocase subunit SecE [Streptococcus sp. LYSM12]
MKFFTDTIQILKDTTWPTKKQSWRDFVSVIQYTIFFVALVYLFDVILSKGLIGLINLF